MKLKRVGIIFAGASVCLATREVAATGAGGKTSTPPPVPPRRRSRNGNATDGRRAVTNGNSTAANPQADANSNLNDLATTPVPRDSDTTARSVPNNPWENSDTAAEETKPSESLVEEGSCEVSATSAPEPPVERVPLILRIEDIDLDKVVVTTVGNVKCFKVVEDANVFSSVEIGNAKKPINCVGPESVVCYVADDKKHYIMVANKIQDSWRRCNLSVEKNKTFIRRDFSSGTKFPVDIDFETIFDKSQEEPVEETKEEPPNVEDQGEAASLAPLNNVLEPVQSEKSPDEANAPVHVQATPNEPGDAVQLPRVPATTPAPTSRTIQQPGRLQAVQGSQLKSAAKPGNAPAGAKEEIVALADGTIEAPVNSTLINTQAIAENDPEIIYTYKHNEEAFLYHYRVKRLPNAHLYHKVVYGSQVPDLLKTLSHLGKPYDSEVPILFWDTIHASALLGGYDVQVFESFSVLDLEAGNEDVLFVMANMELWLPKQASHHLVLYTGATRAWMSLESTKTGSSKRFLITPDPHYPGGCTATPLQ